MPSIRLHKEHGVNPTIPTCFFCGKPKNEIALLGSAYKGEAPMNMCLDKEPCDECRQYMEMGVILVSVRDDGPNTDKENPYRTGAFAVIREEAACRIFGWSQVQSRFCYITDEAWDKMGLPRGEVS